MFITCYSLHAQQQTPNLMFQYYGMSQEPKASLFISQQIDNRNFSNETEKEEFIAQIYSYYKEHEEDLLKQLKVQELINFRNTLKEIKEQKLLNGLSALTLGIHKISQQNKVNNVEQKNTENAIASYNTQTKVNNQYSNSSQSSQSSSLSYLNTLNKQKRENEIRQIAKQYAGNTSNAKKAELIMLEAENAIQQGLSPEEFKKRLSNSQESNNSSETEVRGETSKGQTIFLKVAYNATSNGLPKVRAYRYVKNAGYASESKEWCYVNQTASNTNRETDGTFSEDYKYTCFFDGITVYF